MSILSGLPRTQKVLNLAGYLSDVWDRWLQSVVRQLDASAYGVGSVSESAQTAAIATTAIPIQTVSDGLYRVSYSARITTAASVSSSLTVTIGWTCNTVSCSQSGAAITGNTTATQQNASFVIQCDASSEITYATAYSSTIAGMTYALDVVAEVMP